VALELGLAQGIEDRRVTVVTSTSSAPNGARVTAMPVGPIPVVGNSAMGTNKTAGRPEAHERFFHWQGRSTAERARRGRHGMTFVGHRMVKSAGVRETGQDRR